MRNLTICLLISLLAASAAIATGPGSSMWNQWRGPARTGEAPGPEWPEDLSGVETQWRMDLGKGYSGPVVSSTLVFVAETVDAQTEGARAFDRRTGREVWRTTWAGSGKVPFFAKRNGDWIRSTPSYDGESLFVGGMEEMLHRIDAETGEILWTVDFPERFATPPPDFGFASSPLVDGDSLYVQAANSIVKIDKHTGETLWRALATQNGISRNGAFSSPILATLAGRDYLLVQDRHTLHGVAPETGEVYWSRDVPSFRGMNILTPTVWNDSIFTSSYRNQTHLFTVTEGAGAPLLEEAWIYKANGYMSSPVVIGDDAYLHLGNGRLTCIDLRTGESRWTSTPLGDYWSLAFQGDKMLALTDDGELHLLRSNPTDLEILGTASVSDQSTWGHIAVDRGQVFVRELEGLRALSLDLPPAAVPSR